MNNETDTVTVTFTVTATFKAIAPQSTWNIYRDELEQTATFKETGNFNLTGLVDVHVSEGDVQ